jgi:uncharacterized protein
VNELTDALTDTAVAQYLRDHPDFFLEHTVLLGDLRLPHDRGAGTVSLVERQLEVLRDRNTALDARLQQLVGLARANDVVAARLHQLVRRLVACNTRAAGLQALQQGLADDFGLPDVTLLVFGLGAMDLPPDLRFVTAVDRLEPVLQAFDTVLSLGKPLCGELREAQREALFGTTSSVSSAALLPVGGKQAVALLAIGSPDAKRFTPDMSTDFLERLGELTADLLSRP